MRKNQIVIEPNRGIRLLDWRELLEYRDLFSFLVWRNVRIRYAQSALGVGWAVIQPFLQMIVFTIVFGGLADISSDGAPYAVFSFTALVPWTYFANSVTESANSLVTEVNMISKIYFPRIILPLSAAVAKIVDFAVSLALLFILLIIYQQMPTSGVYFLPLLILIMMLAAIGIGTWLTALAIQYRDIKYAMTFVVQLLMYAAPVVYPVSLVPAQWQPFYALNPMVGVIEGFRSALLGTVSMPWTLIATGSTSAVVLFISGFVYFRSRERIFADVA